MLVLSRRSNEEIVIGDNIRIKILEISGNRIRLGVEAPAHVLVERDELKGALRLRVRSDAP
jgi:carbon storage regulator